MDLQELRKRWHGIWTKAASFVETENMTEAYARARLVAEEIDREMTRPRDAHERAELERLQERARMELQRYERLLDEEERKVRERQARMHEREAEAYHSPLPGGRGEHDAA